MGGIVDPPARTSPVEAGKATIWGYASSSANNQRRSRARRREYIQELEQRLRTFELQGVEASAEVQMAARRVAEENRQLRELLNKHGFGDEYIAQYLQVGTVAPPDPSSQRFTTGDPGSSVQSLQHLIAPRRPAGLETTVPFPLPSQIAREMSTTSVSSANSSAWDPQHPTMPSYGHPHVIPVGPGAVVPQPGHHPYASPVFTEGQVPSRPDQFSPVPPSGSILEDLPPQPGTTQSMVNDNRGSISYNVSMNPYQNPTHRDFAPPGPYY
ncbi:hypothetical protein PT974_00723 [Cladobotryum mycophilum]|uniref:BZIP domain-containing protein n=1 Tax=Cladobotryum mycophilum TaxID=491253 RepID=A0ABR0T296_9HYPO